MQRASAKSRGRGGGGGGERKGSEESVGRRNAARPAARQHPPPPRGSPTSTHRRPCPTAVGPNGPPFGRSNIPSTISPDIYSRVSRLVLVLVHRPLRERDPPGRTSDHFQRAAHQRVSIAARLRRERERPAAARPWSSAPRIAGPQKRLWLLHNRNTSTVVSRLAPYFYFRILFIRVFF